MMRGMDVDICPYQDVLRKGFRGTDKWNELNAYYSKTLFPDLNKTFGVKEEHLNLFDVYPYIDNYYSAYFDQMEIPNDLSDESKLDVKKILRDGLYEGFFSMDLAVRLATTRFFNFLHTTLQWKIDALEGVENTPEFYNEIKYMYLSTHDSSLSAFMSGFQQQQPVQVDFASNIVVLLKVTLLY